MSGVDLNFSDIKKLKEIAKENNLTLKISEEVIQNIRNAHFKEGLSINKIKEVYQKDLLNIGLLYKTKAGTSSKRFVPKGLEFVLKIDKYWLVDLKEFQFIKSRLLIYIKSTEKKYEIQGDINFERSDTVSKLRKIQNYACYECGEKLYDIDLNVSIRKGYNIFF